ncbi:hypothetical protein Tco_1578229, partial [Tanacetum coccineum]
MYNIATTFNDLIKNPQVDLQVHGFGNFFYYYIRKDFSIAHFAL